MNQRRLASAQLWAVALLTLREAARRKVFSILLLFTLIILSSATFLPVVDPDSRLRLIQLWSLRATVLFTAIIAIFLAGFSLPADRENRRIYTLLTKPVSKMTLFLGRLAGFAILLGIFVAGMGLITIIYLRSAQFFGGEDFPELKAEPRIFAAELRAAETAIQLGEHQWLVSDNSTDALVYRFPGLDPADFPEEIRAECTMGVSGRRESLLFAGDVLVSIGGKIQPDPVRVRNESPVLFTFPRDLIPESGELEIRLQRGDEDINLGGRPDGLVLYGDSELYEWNYAKGSLLLCFQIAILLAVTMAASTIVSAPVSILLGIFIFFVSMVHGFVEDGLKQMDLSKVDRHGHERDDRPPPETPFGIPEWMLDASSVMARGALAAVGGYQKYDFSPYLLEDRAVSAKDLSGPFLEMLIRVGVLVILGILLIMGRQVE